MKYYIIPEVSDLSETLAISKQNKVNLEYNDFISPGVYGEEKRIEELIDLYSSQDRDRSSDTMHGAFLGLDLGAVDPVLKNRSRELMLQSMSIADRLGIKGVVFHTGLIGGLRLEYYLDNWLKEAESFFKQICEDYPGLTVFLENSFEQEPDIFLKLMEKMGEIHNFKLCLDYGHAILTPTPVEEWVKAFAPYIGHMHLNDNDLVDDLHLVPGSGKIDFTEWYELLRKYNIDVPVLLELRGNSNIREALDYMSRFR